MTDNTETFFCPACGASLKSSMGYVRCPDCNTPLPDHLKPAKKTVTTGPVCPQCGRATTSPFCPGCGTAINPTGSLPTGTLPQSTEDQGYASYHVPQQPYPQPGYPQQPYPQPGYPQQPFQVAPGYRQNQPYYAPAPMFQQHVPNRLVESILVTLFCCLPLGIAAIVFSAQVDGKLAAGDYEGALSSSKTAHILNIVSASVTVVFIGLYILLIILGSMAH